jgi:hypothetical protein
MELVSVLRVDQARRWERGDAVVAESYLARFHTVRDDADAAIDLIYGEFVLREALGDRCDPHEYFSRFPEHAEVLRPQIELHRAMATHADLGSLIAPRTRLEPMGDTGLDPALPRRFGRYEIIKTLGKGGMGTVYVAHDTQLDRTVALKVPRFGTEMDAHIRERFYREARIAATFSHPLLCPVYDVGELDGIHYLTMPLLKGEPLSDKLKRVGVLPAAEAVRIAAQVARALAVAHQAGVVHRDLKPANIMINQDREPIVMDFGLASRRAASDIDLTHVGDIFGTPAYMAPEQIGGDSRIVGPASDVYSLGAILYQMLTGRIPFEGLTHEVWRQALTCEPERPSRIRPELDPRLDAVCLAAMAKDPAQRFRSMDAFAEALESSTSPVAAIVIDERERVRRLVRRGVVAGVLVMAGLLLGVIAMAGRPRSQAPPDALPVHSRWTGDFRFRSPLDYTGDVELTVQERSGDRFRANYQTENGQYEWEVDGTLRDGAITGRFTRAIRDNAEHDVVGIARLDGRAEGGRLKLTFTQYAHVADLSLRRADR